MAVSPWESKCPERIYSATPDTERDTGAAAAAARRDDASHRRLVFHLLDPGIALIDLDKPDPTTNSARRDPMSAR